MFWNWLNSDQRLNRSGHKYKTLIRVTSLHEWSLGICWSDGFYNPVRDIFLLFLAVSCNKCLFFKRWCSARWCQIHSKLCYSGFVITEGGSPTSGLLPFSFLLACFLIFFFLLFFSRGHRRWVSIGPFKVLRWVDEVAYQLALPPSFMCPCWKSRCRMDCTSCKTRRFTSNTTYLRGGDYVDSRPIFEDFP